MAEKFVVFISRLCCGTFLRKTRERRQTQNNRAGRHRCNGTAGIREVQSSNINSSSRFSYWGISWFPLAKSFARRGTIKYTSIASFLMYMSFNWYSHLLFCMRMKLIFHVSGRSHIEGVWEQGDERNIWEWEWGSGEHCIMRSSVICAAH
jgi:hypothetical protein